MKNEISNRASVMRSCEYCVETMRNIRKSLLDISNSKQEILWAVGSIIIVLATGILSISHEVLMKTDDEPASAIEDLKEIQKRFNEFMDQMIEGNS